MKSKVKKGETNHYLDRASYPLFRRISTSQEQGLPSIEWVQCAPRLHLERNQREKNVRYKCAEFFIGLLWVWALAITLSAGSLIVHAGNNSASDMRLFLVAFSFIVLIIIIWPTTDWIVRKIWEKYIDGDVLLMPHMGYALYAERYKLRIRGDTLEYLEHTGENWKIIYETPADSLESFFLEEQPEHNIGDFVRWNSKPRFNRLFAHTNLGQTWEIALDYDYQQWIRNLRAELHKAFIDQRPPRGWNSDQYND